MKLLRDMLQSEGKYSANKILGTLGSLLFFFLSTYALTSKHHFSEVVIVTVFSSLLGFIFTMFKLRTDNIKNMLKFGQPKSESNGN